MSATVMVVQRHQVSAAHREGACHCGGATHDAGAVHPAPTKAPDVAPDERPNGDGGAVWMRESYRKAGKPIPRWLTANDAATRAAPKPTADRSTVLRRMADTVAEIARIASGLPDPRPVRQYAMPTPVDAALSDDDPDTKSPDGAPHGDARIMRRRRATELERLLRENRKVARAKAPNSAARARWDAEYQELSAELAAIREAERNERGEYKKF